MKHLPLQTKRAHTERYISYVLFAFAAISIATTIGIILVLLWESIAFFSKVSLAQFWADSQWTPLFADKHFGIWPLLTGTLLTTFVALSVALPIGLLSAIYLSELAKESTRKWLKPALELLAGIPTVVYGYFALTFITPILQTIVPGLGAFNALGAGVVMGIMISPMIASLSEDAIYAVPANIKEGAYALGATKLSTIFRIILPTASSGLFAAVLLGFSRAIGETMIVAIAAGQQPTLTLDPRQPIETMTAYIAQVSLGDTPSGTLEYQTIFAVGATLFALTLLLNIASHRFRKRAHL
jgi:phosphate transport system permease protein